jgi:hypothetical protein
VAINQVDSGTLTAATEAAASSGESPQGETVRANPKGPNADFNASGGNGLRRERFKHIRSRRRRLPADTAG